MGMTRQQTFLVTGFKKSFIKKREKKKKKSKGKKIEQNPFAQFYVNIICREYLELERREKKSVVFTWNTVSLLKLQGRF